MKKPPIGKALCFASTLLIMAILLGACAPAAAPTPTPTKAPAAASPTTAAPKTEPTKPAGQPAATPTTAAAAKPTGAPISIGFLTPLTGRVAQSGQLQKIASAMGEEDINKAGGINGSPIKIIMEDSGCDPKQAVSLTRKVAEQDKVFAVLGPYCTGEYEVAAPLANQLQIPVITTISTKQGISAANRPWAFRVALTQDIIIPAALAAFKKQYPNVKRMVISGDTKEAVAENAVKRTFPQALKDMGYEVIDTVSFETGTTDFSAIITKIKSLSPEGIAYESFGAEAIGFAKELQRQGLKLPAVTGTSFWVGPYLAQAGGAMDGWITAPWFDQDSTDPKVQQWVARYKGIADADAGVVKPVFVTVEAHHYDTMMALTDIMRKAGIKADTPLQEARTKIRDGFQSLKEYSGMVGPITMNASGDASWKPVSAMAQGAKWVVMK